MCSPVAQIVTWLPSTVLEGATVYSLMYVMLTPGTHPLGLPAPPDEPVPDPPLEPPNGSPPNGTGGDGAGGGLGPGGGLGTVWQGTGCLSVIVIPWSLTLTGCPFAVTCPPTTWASPPALETLLVAVTSTVTWLTRTLPTAKL